MYAAQQLLHQQHPDVLGLQDPLLQRTHTFNIQRGQFVQCLNVADSHWITVSSIGCPPSVVRVYDSMAMPLTLSVKNVIAEIMHSEKDFHIQYVACQQQRGIDDCALFAIANATTLCCGGNPATAVYHQAVMRQHLIEQKALEPFPLLTSKRKRTKECYKEETVAIYCICRMPYGHRKMVQCTSCKNIHMKRQTEIKVRT